MTDHQSVTHWIHELKEGQEILAQHELWRRYFHRLTTLARKKLDTSPRRVADEEDVALDVLNSCFTRVKQGSFPDLHDRTDLWRLLVKITTRKAINQKREQLAQKRGSGKVRGESVFLTPSAENRWSMAEHVTTTEPKPDVIAAIDEELCRRMGMLNDDLRRVARLKLEGYSNQEIAERLGRVKRTVERKLRRIRQLWTADRDQHSD